MRRPSSPAAPSHAYGQHPVKRTLVTLLVGGIVCCVIVALGELGILHYPERADRAPDSQAVQSAPVQKEASQGGAGQGIQGRPADTSDSDQPDVSDSSSSVQKAPGVVTTKLRRMIDEGKVSSIRVLGDSITAGYLCDGYGAPSDTGVVVYSGPQGTFDETATTVHCWTNDFRTYATDHGVTSFVNAGISGFRMQYLAEDPSAWLGDGADVIVVMLGTNDAARRSVEEFSADAEIGLAAAASKCKLLIVVSPPTNDRTDTTNRYSMDRVDKVLTELCRMKGYVHVSLLDALELGTQDFNADLVHPTSMGSDKLWQSFATQLDLL